VFGFLVYRRYETNVQSTKVKYDHPGPIRLISIITAEIHEQPNAESTLNETPKNPNARASEFSSFHDNGSIFSDRGAQNAPEPAVAHRE
jgi:hypothetical protein